MFNQVKSYPGTAFMLFLFVFIYLLIRAIYTEPLHDEIATYYFYIYHGEFIGEDFAFDANNHFLNSFLGYGIRRFIGDHFFLFRLPNLLSFIIYFWSAFKILEPIKENWLRILGLCAVVCVPFMIEYFAYTRGYGLGIAFFLLGVKWLIDFQKTAKTKYLIGLFVACWLAIFSNFIFLNPTLVVIGYLFINQLITNNNWLRYFLLNLLFIASLSPFVFLMFKLKEHGALYYGSLAGLWDVTGKSLSKMVFFADGNLVFMLISVLLIMLLIAFGLHFWKKPLKETFQFSLSPIGFLFFGALVLILILAFVLKINYPEDRTGMYLIPLFILLIVFVLDYFERLRFLKWVLLFFPISFGLKMPLHGSIYSPDQRMSVDFYDKVKAKMNKETSICSYHMNIWTWNYHESNQKNKSSFLCINAQDAPVFDIILGKLNTIHNKAIFENYDTIAYNPITSDVALKRKKALDRKILFTSTETSTWANWEYVSIFESDSLDFISKNKPLQISAEFELKTFQPKSNLQLVFQLFDSEGAEIERVFHPLGLVYRNQWIDEKMLHHVVFPNFPEHTKVIKVYLWNKDLEALELKNGKCYLYELN